jgi:hypothetical protein
MKAPLTAFPRPGDRVVAREPIPEGALVYFERAGPTEVVVQLVPVGGAPASATVYRAARGEHDGAVRFVLVT